MRRREFIALLGSATASSLTWPLTVRAQQAEPMRRVGILLAATADDTEFQAWVGAFAQELQKLGWSIGHNVRIDTRWATADAAAIRKHASELVALAPDVILAHGASCVGPLLQVTRTVPIVFPIAGDPVGAGFVDSLARPGGNATGFMSTEFSMGGKWLELLKQTAPDVTRAAVLRDTTQGSGTSQFAAIQAVAPSLRMEVNPVNMREAGEIERAVTTFARSPGWRPNRDGGCGCDASSRFDHCARGAVQAARSLLRTTSLVAAGGLISYGPDFVDQYRHAAGYVDRILKGENPADLPVQASTKYAMVINLKTAKALGLTIPPSVLARADEVIE